MVAHSCVLSWWRAVKGEPAPAEWDRYREAVAEGLRAADLVVAPTLAMLRGLRDDHGPIAPSRVIPNGRDGSLYAPAAKEPTILSAGRLWDEAKNIEALASVAPSLPWPVYVAGDEAHPERGATPFDSVRPLGRLSPAELARWYARTSIYALPARYEPFGLSALEAALSGCALVLGDIPSLREVWGDAAAFVPPGDPRALRSALEGLIRDPTHRLRMAEAARRRALAYSADCMARAYRDAYRELLADRAAESSPPPAPAASASVGGRPPRLRES
jgi:glycosyltransferase involved in cell wall biosynthesis